MSKWLHLPTILQIRFIRDAPRAKTCSCNLAIQPPGGRTVFKLQGAGFPGFPPPPHPPMPCGFPPEATPLPPPSRISLHPPLGCFQGPDTMRQPALYSGESQKEGQHATTQQYFLGRYEGSSIFTRAGDTKCSALRGAHHLVSFPFTKVEFHLEKPADP